MKDHVGFLRAAAAVADRFPEAYFLLIGRGVTIGDPELAGLIPSDMRDRFCLLGERGDVARLLAAIDALCLSSAWGEAFPNVVGEAMAAGRPCIVTDVGDCAAIVGDTGLVVPPADGLALERALAEMLAMDPPRRRHLGGLARARVEARFSLRAVSDAYAELYEGMAQPIGSGSVW
jgi:glycosyltransferase involved in cell wall biosynthesis